ncbi:hypothetical protein SARC_04413 [Sphaeroforma arctica JP610]|uniref:ER membrane protein complex subunit 3 n=1 Tax=Sphaeroforma arctica JP610 TaxID=667725 RepID=A0A0L0G2F5_9EUKA|nr:hypothetical protein SARC_04413 [Sphaeroforma arctica JP610]KNC83317.1 hypothetical protein SARC_04413 [Sphaeroforma arctica JP610]|eukprot:XP_014157219.1 hypothetical protein SARC_04413 [Sphaeroforma arctica JP610]
MTNLFLDPNIRDWVFIPLVLVMLAVGILRANIAKLMASEKKPKKQDIIDNGYLQRARMLRANGRLISKESFAMRKSFFNHESKGFFRQEREQANPTQDPNMMADMMKGNMSMILPQILLMTWVNQFFYGFLTTQVPFPLTLKFKEMTQRGVELQALDATWISSLSWYFLIVYGIQGLQILITGSAGPNDEKRMAEQMSGGGGGPQQPDMNVIFKQEREGLELVDHDYDLDKVEGRLLGLTQGKKFD